MTRQIRELPYCDAFFQISRQLRVISSEEIDELVNRGWVCLDLAACQARKEDLLVAR